MLLKYATTQEFNHCQEDGKRLSQSVEEAQDEVRSQSEFQPFPNFQRPTYLDRTNEERHLTAGREG